MVLINYVFKCSLHFGISIHIPSESYKAYKSYKFGFKTFKMALHTGSATSDQIDTLLNFLDEHRDLARGRLRSVEGNVQAKRLWEELCNTLNSMGGTKTIQQWQKPHSPHTPEEDIVLLALMTAADCSNMKRGMWREKLQEHQARRH